MGVTLISLEGIAEGFLLRRHVCKRAAGSTAPGSKAVVLTGGDTPRKRACRRKGSQYSYVRRKERFSPRRLLIRLGMGKQSQKHYQVGTTCGVLINSRTGFAPKIADKIGCFEPPNYILFDVLY